MKTTQTFKNVHLATFAAALTLSLAGGCASKDRPTLFANPDPALDRTKSEWQADGSESRYPEDAPKSREVKARAQVGYDLNRLEVVQFTGQEWRDVEVWVNQKYVCRVPAIQDRTLKQIHFPMLYARDGEHFPTNNSVVRVEKVEIFRDGKLYELVCHNADF